MQRPSHTWCEIVRTIEQEANGRSANGDSIGSGNYWTNRAKSNSPLHLKKNVKREFDILNHTLKVFGDDNFIKHPTAPNFPLGKNSPTWIVDLLSFLNKITYFYHWIWLKKQNIWCFSHCSTSFFVT